MQIAQPIIPETTQNFSLVAPAAPTSAQLWFAKTRAFVRWTFDVDDGAGAAVCFLCVLAVFGTLVVRLVELDHSLDSQSLKCSAVNTKSLEMKCEFQ